PCHGLAWMHSRGASTAWNSARLELPVRGGVASSGLRRVNRRRDQRVSSGVMVRPESSMNEGPAAAQVRTRTALGVVVLAGIVVLAAEAGLVAAGVVGFH